MNCPRCGFDAKNMNFCPNCGLKMPTPQPSNQQPAHSANPYAAPVQNAARVTPVPTAAAHVTPIQSTARVSSVPSSARVTAVAPPKSKNKALLIAAIIIGAVVVSGIVIAVLSGIFYNRSVFSTDEEQTAAQVYTTDIDSESSRLPEA